jgi:shikimate dehydrogenase
MKIMGTTEIYGILGHPIEHTLSPLMHNAAFQALGIDGCYVAFDVKPKDLKKAIRGLAASGVRGFNLTIPHKEKAIAFLDEVSPEAARIGAVNTVVIRQDRLIGHNTDGPGFVRAFSETTGVLLKDKRVLLFGAGGAARAVAFYLAKQCVKSISILNRTLPRARTLIREFERDFKKVDWIAKALSPEELSLEFHQGIDILINTTSVGMKPNDPPIVSKAFLKRNQVVCDLIYQPMKTRLLSEADAAGAKIVNGVGMLLHQAALAFELWTGKRPPIALMKDALENHINSQSVFK